METRQSKKFTSLILAVLIVVTLFAFEEGAFSEVTDSLAQLVIYTGAPSVLADNNSYPYVFVQLQNSSGKPTRASEDITIGLSVSLSSIGSVDPSITIKKGSSIATANFTSTFNPGTTTIFASATGYSTVTANLTTVGPIPSALGAYAVPSTLPADSSTYEAIMVQLQDSSGFPARAPKGGVNLALTSSNTTIGIVSSAVSIIEGQTYANASFTTTEKAGATNITAVSQGYTAGQVTITTTPLASNPTKLKIYTGPPQTPADAGSQQVAIQLQNASGYPAKALANITVNAASNDDSICKIEGVTIPSGQTCALVTLATTYKAGSATITAVANDFPSTGQLIRTAGFNPSKLAIFCLPSTLPADGTTYPALEVQLQDAQGRPARTEKDVTVKLFSTQPAIGSVSASLTIPTGRTQESANFTTSYMSGTNTITAQAPGYTMGQTSLSSCIIDRYKIFSEAIGNGKITPSGSVIVNIGDNQSFNIAAYEGYHIADVLVNKESVGSVSSYTFRNVSESYTITVIYEVDSTSAATSTPAPTETPTSTPTNTPTAFPTPTPSPSPDTSSSPNPTTTEVSSNFFSSIPMSVRYVLAAVLVIVTSALAYIVKRKLAGDKLFVPP